MIRRILDKTAAIPYDYPSYKLTFSFARVFMIDVVVKCGLLRLLFSCQKMNRKMSVDRNLQYRIVPLRPTYLHDFHFREKHHRTRVNHRRYCSVAQPSPHGLFIDNPFIMSALVPRVGTGMSVQSQMSGRPSGRTPSGSALACNRCSKPLATTCFLCSCDCIFCEGELFTSFVFHFCW
jgi:hypothetical protein